MGPLTGIKILDFTSLLPGPTATLMLADLGAEVLRIGSKTRPDFVLKTPPRIPGTQVNALEATLGRNKKTVTLNMKTNAAREVVYRMVKDYDIVIDQFRPGTMEKMGLGYETLKKYNPGVICCSLTGYGQTGPLRDVAGHDINYLARSGVMSYSGRRKTGPALYGPQIADIGAGTMNTALAVLAAVIHRNRTGEGQYIDVSMLDCCLALLTARAPSFLASGKAPGMETERTNGGSLYDFYETKDGKYLSVGCLEQKFFENFCAAIGKPEWGEDTCSPKNLEERKGQLGNVLRSKTRDEWLEIFRDTDACVEPVLDFDEVLLRDEQVEARKMVVDVPTGAGGTVKQIANGIKFHGTPAEYWHIGYPMGFHTKHILEQLDYSDEEIEALEACGALE